MQSAHPHRPPQVSIARAAAAVQYAAEVAPALHVCRGQAELSNPFIGEFVAGEEIELWPPESLARDEDALRKPLEVLQFNMEPSDPSRSRIHGGSSPAESHVQRPAPKRGKGPSVVADEAAQANDLVVAAMEGIHEGPFEW